MGVFRDTFLIADNEVRFYFNGSPGIIIVTIWFTQILLYLLFFRH